MTTPERKQLEPCTPSKLDEALHNIIELARPFMTDEAQRLGLSLAETELAKLRRANSVEHAPAPLRPGDVRIIDGRQMRFIEAELEGLKWEVLAPAPDEAAEREASLLRDLAKSGGKTWFSTQDEAALLVGADAILARRIQPTQPPEGPIWLRFAENGNIRKWDTKPFDGAVRYETAPAPPHADGVQEAKTEDMLPTNLSESDLRKLIIKRARETAEIALRERTLGWYTAPYAGVLLNAMADALSHPADDGRAKAHADRTQSNAGAGE